MDEPILFNPDNRLLGAAIGDLGMYGGQSQERFSVHEARYDAGHSTIKVGSANVATALEHSNSTEVTSLPETSAAVSTQADLGSGSLSAHSFLIPLVMPEMVTAQPIGGEAVGLVQSGAVSAAQGVGTSISALDLAAEAMGSASGGATSSGVAEAPMMGTATSLIDSLADGPTTAPMAGPTTGLVEGAAVPAANAVGALVTAATGPLDDALDGLTGSDPLAGVETLVSMVSTSDTFDLAPVVAPLLETVSDTGLDMVDALVGEDTLPETLLGSHHEDGGLLGLDHHDNPLGL